MSLGINDYHGFPIFEKYCSRMTQILSRISIDNYLTGFVIGNINPGNGVSRG
jgi:hypothetical protein